MSGKKNILVVEDDVIISMEICDRLENLGFHVVNALISGEEAIRDAEMFSPYLI